MITIVDYGVGNLASIKNILKKIGAESVISADESVIAAADKLILPGVGAFDTCAEKLQQSGLQDILNKKALHEKIPVLGVCVGMQLLTDGSEEGKLPGLGWIRGRIVRFRQEDMPAGYKIPHMGWTEVELNKPSGLFKDMYEEPRFYFVHSYYPVPQEEKNVLLYAQYGKRFAAGMEQENIMGVQFHPEKSHKFGMKLLHNFVKNY
ncbi:MAG TPA: imidazole glycerol phosphate synthase subunit HisH [Flavitalea sp.]|nr:imidazole glycerol phosphate synthase subunit HisH [Flavitalea sp.]